jgi:hypothetical protein
MRPRTTLLAGLVLGGFLALAYLLAGPLTLFPGLVVWAWLLRRRPRLVATAGGLIGFGAIWLLLIGRASWACAIDPSCSQPSVIVLWLAIGAVFLARPAWCSGWPPAGRCRTADLRSAIEAHRGLPAEALPAPDDPRLIVAHRLAIVMGLAP